jgi:hypothetical protein
MFRRGLIWGNTRWQRREKRRDVKGGLRKIKDMGAEIDRDDGTDF